ncbi:MAG: Crp/Fnr family transcriptional regulator [Bacteroidota bacterium]
MERESLYSFVQAIHPCPRDVIVEYVDHWEEVSYGRKEVITPAGQIERYIYFVLEGEQRAYFLKHGKEHIIAFTYPPSLSGVPESFLTQRPSHFTLETITPSKLIRISYEKHEHLLARHRELETLMRKATEQVLAGIVQQYHERLALSIAERFAVFMQRSRHLLQRIPHKYLASYLNMDPTNFSKLLKQYG